MNEFKLAREILSQEDRIQLQIAKQAAIKCSWEDPLDVAEYMKDYNMKERMEIISRIHPTLECPTCKTKIEESYKWIVSKDKKKALCKSCHQYLTYNKIESPDDQKSADDLFQEAPKRFVFDSHLFVKVRCHLGISAGKFAELCGWSRQYQSKLEDGEFFTISEEKRDVIQKVLEKLSTKNL